MFKKYLASGVLCCLMSNSYTAQCNYNNGITSTCPSTVSIQSQVDTWISQNHQNVYNAYRSISSVPYSTAYCNTDGSTSWYFNDYTTKAFNAGTAAGEFLTKLKNSYDSAGVTSIATQDCATSLNSLKQVQSSFTGDTSTLSKGMVCKMAPSTARCTVDSNYNQYATLKQRMLDLKQNCY